MIDLNLDHLSVAEQEQLLALISEASSRGLDIDLAEYTRAPAYNWPMDDRGYFSKLDGTFYNPIKSQQDFVDSDSVYVGFYGSRGSGKALALNTEVPTPNGWKFLCELSVGDYVFSSDGNPIKILYKSPVYKNHSCYEIEFSGGEKVVADGDHLWEVQTYKDRNKYGEFSDNSLSIISTELLSVCDKKYYSTYVFSVFNCCPVKYFKKDLLIHPYLLGVWLGDGNSRDARLTIHDNDLEIIETIQDCGYHIHKTKDLYSWSLGGTKQTNTQVQSDLRKLGVLNNKHIPSIYLQSSIEQRIDLLKGLMDTDGTITKKGHCSFSTSNYNLSCQFIELISSLGIKSNICFATPKLNGKRFESFRISFTPGFQVFNLFRKSVRQIKSPRSMIYRRAIESVKRVNSVPVQCIKVDSDNGMFLITRSFIPTHNSSAGSQKALRKIKDGENGLIANASFENLKISTWPEFREWIPWQMVVPAHRYRKHPKWQPSQPFKMTFVNGATVIIKGIKDADSARGPNVNWFWFDEAQRTDDALAWQIAVASVRVGENPQSWATFTPNGSDHWTTKFFVNAEIPEDAYEILRDLGKDRPLVESFHGTLFDNKENLSPEFVAAIMAAYPEGWLRDQEVFGRIVKREGALGNPAWFDGKIIPSIPSDVVISARCRYWDIAATEKKLGVNDPDETVGTKMSWSKDSDKFFIEDQTCGYWEWTDIKNHILQTAILDGPYVPIYIEQEPASGGKNQVAAIKEFLQEKLPGVTVRGHNPKEHGDKVMRANYWFSDAAEGKIYMIQGNWNGKTLEQLGCFNFCRHDDRIDSISGARVNIAPIGNWVNMEFLSV